jgi:hypothetical protein
MLIVSQDREEILNFENIENIWISAEEGRYTIEATADTNTTLGFYNTKEKAKEIIAQIVELYEKCQIVVDERNRLVNYVQRPKVYRMPEE